jgi:nucleotide-binding universal stress UspA family protein
MIYLHANKILTPIDFSKTSVKAIKHAAEIARLFKGELILLNVQKESDLVDIILPAIKLKDYSVITNFISEKLEKQAEKIRHGYNIKVSTLVSTGNVTSEIVSVANEKGVGLIVMGTHGRDSENEFLFLGSNSYRTLTKSNIPVMTVRTNTKKTGYSNILLPIDLSEHSRQKVNIAIQLASKFDAHLHVLGLLGKNETKDEYSLKVFLSQIKKIAKGKKLIYTSEIVPAEHRAKQTLAYAQKTKSDLIIVMSDQSAELSRIFLGTYAHQLINDAKMPVLCIPPETHPENAPDSIGGGGMW